MVRIALHQTVASAVAGGEGDLPRFRVAEPPRLTLTTTFFPVNAASVAVSKAAANAVFDPVPR